MAHLRNQLWFGSWKMAFWILILCELAVLGIYNYWGIDAPVKYLRTSTLKNNRQDFNMDLDDMIPFSPWETFRKQVYKHNCSSYFNGDVNRILQLKQILHKYPYQEASANSVYNWVTPCSSYVKYYSFQNKQVTEEERNFPIAFSIRMHQSVEQAEHLLRNIYAPQNIYCIYIDKKSSAEIHKTMRQIVSCFDNVFIASKLENFYYASPTHIGADNQCMRDTLKVSSTWKYFINLVGEDFPIKTNLELVRMLKILNGSNGIHSTPLSTYEAQVRLKYIYEVVDGTYVKTNQTRPLFKAISAYYKGAEYNLFSRAFVNWSLTADHPIQFYKYLQGGALASDEIYWPTLNHHPDAPGGYKYNVPRFSKARIWAYHLRLIGQRDAFPCRGPIIRGICIFTVSELPWLRIQPEPFANKFKIMKDPFVTDCLSEMLRHKRVNGIVDDLSYFRLNPVVYDKVVFDNKRHIKNKK